MTLVIDRFWSKVDFDGPDDCWRWTGGRKSTGYGVFGWRRDGRTVSVHAHRFAYELERGPIPGQLPLDHLCRTPLCVNPAHLEPVTMRENTLRGIGPSAVNAVATHCKHGHEFTPENTWVDAKRRTRHCRTCMRRRWHEWKARKAG